MPPTNRTLATRNRWGMTHPFEYDRTPEASWYEVALYYALTIAAGGAVGLVVYYAL